MNLLNKKEELELMIKEYFDFEISFTTAMWEMEDDLETSNRKKEKILALEQNKKMFLELLEEDYTNLIHFDKILDENSFYQTFDRDRFLALANKEKSNELIG